MSEEVNVPVETVAQETKGGKVTFASEVIAIIASLAAGEVKGIASMSGSTFEGITEKLGRKSYTKGVKVEVGNEEAAVDLFVIVRYGFKIHDVCVDIQNAVKNAIETMTGLRWSRSTSTSPASSSKKSEGRARPRQGGRAPRVR